MATKKNGTLKKIGSWVTPTTKKKKLKPKSSSLGIRG